MTAEFDTGKLDEGSIMKRDLTMAVTSDDPDWSIRQQSNNWSRPVIRRRAIGVA